MEVKMKSNKKEKIQKPQKEKKPKKQKEEIFNDEVRAAYYRRPDNKKSSALKYLLDALVILFIVMYGLIIAYTIQSSNNGGIPTFAGTAYVDLKNDGQNMLSLFKVGDNYVVNTTVGYRVYDESGNRSVKTGIVNKVKTDELELKDGTTIKKDLVIGTYDKEEKASFFYSLMTDKLSFIYWCVLPLIIFIIIALTSYYVLYPRKVKLNFFEQMFNGENDTTLTSSSLQVAPVTEKPKEEVKTDDSIKEYSVEEGDNPIPGTNIETFYTTTKSKDGQLYALVKQYPEAIADLQEYGASDMDLIRMNMVGNSEFNALINTTHRERPMTLAEIIGYISTFDDIYCIKKRGAINWTYKYKSKTVMIVRGSDKEYKVSFKVYPDAAAKLNEVYCALEDSSFPSGPYWFMFNDLKNLSAPVAKWLIKESYIISMMQERKAELVRNDKTCADLGVDMAAIKAQIDSGVNILSFDKFAVVAHKIDKNKLALNTLLDQTIPGLYTEKYVKEVFYIVNGRDDLALSLLFAKNASEQLINALCMEIEDACSTAGSNMDESVHEQIPTQKTTTKVVRKQVKRK